MEKENNCCFSNILKVIDVLQRNAEKFDNQDESCSRPFLGNLIFGDVYNTRPVTFYAKDGSLYTLPVVVDEIETTSSIFRVEKVNDCCVTVRILIPNPNPTDLRPYVITNQTATINLDCVCALQCLPDVVVDNV